jgi:hypothetical protein
MGIAQIRRLWCRLFHRQISRLRLGGYYDCLVPGCFERWRYHGRALGMVKRLRAKAAGFPSYFPSAVSDVARRCWWNFGAFPAEVMGRLGSLETRLLPKWLEPRG